MLYSDSACEREVTVPASSRDSSGRQTCMRNKQWLMDLQAACEVCGYENGMYVVYIPDDVTRPSKEDLVQRILGRRSKIVLYRGVGGQLC